MQNKLESKEPITVPGKSHVCSRNYRLSQNKEGILPVATLSIALYVLRRSMSASDVAPEVAICYRLYKHQ